MKHRIALRRWAVASLVLAPVTSLLAADPGVKLEAPKGPEKNRFGVSYRAGFNFTAEFKNVGNIARPPAGRDPGPATGGGVDRFYDDGYNRVDVSGNKDGLTWFWGYKNASQVTANDTLEMHSTTATPIKGGTYDSDPQHGFELTYDRELGRLRQGKLPWGFEVAFGWTDIEIRDHRQLAGGVRTITDAFGLEGVDPSRNVVPDGQQTPPPYNEGGAVFNPGSYEGPGTLIEDNPNRRVDFDPTGSRVTGLREFNADLFSFRLGPYLDIPIDDKWTISLSAGLAVGVIDGEYHFDQNVTTTSGSVRQTGTGGNTDVFWGGYASGSIRYAIDEHWGLFASGQYMGFSDCYRATARGQTIELDLARTAFFSLGVSYSF